MIQIQLKNPYTGKWELNCSVFHSICQTWSLPGPLYYPNQYEMLPFLLQGRMQPSFIGRCSDNTVALQPAICIPPSTSHSQDIAQTERRKSKGYPHSTVMAETGVVLKSPSPHSGNASPPSSQAGSLVTEVKYLEPSQPLIFQSEGIAPRLFCGMDLTCLDNVQSVLLSSRKPTTHETYFHKWKCFYSRCSLHSSQAREIPFCKILESLMDLKTQGLSVSSVRIYLAAITAFQLSIGGFSVYPSYHNQIP